MKRNIAIMVVLIVVFSLQVTMAFSQDTDTSARDKAAPWLKGVTIGPHPKDLSPVLPLKIYDENGDVPPATMTEDVEVVFTADSKIFDDTPPTSYKGEEIANPRWMRPPGVNWSFIDWEINKSTRATSRQGLAVNQMRVKPLKPTGRGNVTCHIGRRMKYDDPVAGHSKGTFVNSSGSSRVRVLDITPPTCGLEISVKDGKTGTFWTVENPPNEYPLPKHAQIFFSGSLCLLGARQDNIILSDYELGPDMVVTKKQAAVTVPANSILTLKVVGEDNYKLDNDKVRFGICDGAGGEPKVVGDVNPPDIDLSVQKLPKKPYLFVDASDMAGNRQTIFVPLIVKETGE